jgi:hypothetical protein
METNREYVTSKGQIRSLTAEWDKLTAEAERLTREYQETRNNLEVE